MRFLFLIRGNMPEGTGQLDLSPAFSQLDEKARRLSVLLDQYGLKEKNNPFEKIVMYLLQVQDESGAWNPVDYPGWTDVITALAIQVLSFVGFHEDTVWEVTRSSSAAAYHGGLKKAIDYLIRHQQQSGRWGEDLFDTCQVLKALLPFSSKLNFTDRIDLGLSYLREEINVGMRDECSGEWYGPGFLAAGVEAFRLAGDSQMAGLLLEQLYSHQNENGSFCGPDTSDGSGVNDLTVWHTALAILTMHSLGMPSNAKKLASAVEWIAGHQNKDGSWGLGLARHRAIYTGYGVMALAATQGKDAPAVSAGVDWLVHRQSQDGRVGGLEGTIMAALAFTRVLTFNVSATLPFTVLLDTQQLITAQMTALDARGREIAELRAALGTLRVDLGIEQGLHEELGAKLAVRDKEIEQLNSRVVELEAKDKAWEERWSDYPIRLSNKAVTVSGWIVGVVSLVLAVVALLPMLVPMQNTSSGAPATATAISAGSTAAAPSPTIYSPTATPTATPTTTAIPTTTPTSIPITTAIAPALP